MVSVIFFENHIENLVESILRETLDKIPSFETIDIETSSQCSYDDSQGYIQSFKKDQDVNCGVNVKKKVLLSFYYVLNASEALIQNVSFLDIDYSHSAKIFDSYLNLLKSFQMAINASIKQLLSINTMDSPAANPKKSFRLALSANLIMDENRFRSFYNDFGVLIDSRENMGIHF